METHSCRRGPSSGCSPHCHPRPARPAVSAGCSRRRGLLPRGPPAPSPPACWPCPRALQQRASPFPEASAAQASTATPPGPTTGHSPRSSPAQIPPRGPHKHCCVPAGTPPRVCRCQPSAQAGRPQGPRRPHIGRAWWVCSSLHRGRPRLRHLSRSATSFILIVLFPF